MFLKNKEEKMDKTGAGMIIGPFEPKILVCVECGKEFVFTASAQQYFAELGYIEDPKWCKHCYVSRKRQRKNNEPPPAKTQG
ncbi:MAG: zinc-ribbon domain containing protein [Patescibacteria group bacterium]